MNAPRTFRRGICWLCFFVHGLGGMLAPAASATNDAAEDRVRGLLLGSLIGDAFGGPMEFVPRVSWQKLEKPPKQWQPGEILDDKARQALRERLILRPYTTLRPVPEPYAHWSSNAPPGTITDDSRHKLILFHALRGAARTPRAQLSKERFAQAYLDWTNTPAITRHAGFSSLCHEWLEEYWLAARWVLGERNLQLALPPERLWNSLPTCAGQMALLPLAGIFPGQPRAAYLAAWDIAWLDNGLARDLNAAIVAGLAAALVQPLQTDGSRQKWEAIFSAMRQTDPWRFQQVPWSTRPLEQWLDFALKSAAQAEGQPARLFAVFDREFARTVKWEAQLCFAVAIGCIALCPEDPLAALALTIEWGHDTDSYAQLAGAFIGAAFGAGLFPSALVAPVENRLRADYHESLAEWVKLLSARRLAP